MEETLIPCPFCGAEAELVRNSSGSYFARCTNKQCAAKTRLYHENENGARLAWNRRAERTCQIVVSVDRSPASYGGRVHRCSSCRKALPGSLFRNGWTKLDYCPRCGARVMKVVRDAD